MQIRHHPQPIAEQRQAECGVKAAKPPAEPAEPAKCVDSLGSKNFNFNLGNGKTFFLPSMRGLSHHHHIENE